jgi:hypothetical protein
MGRRRADRQRRIFGARSRGGGVRDGGGAGRLRPRRASTAAPWLRPLRAAVGAAPPRRPPAACRAVAARRGLRGAARLAERGPSSRRLDWRPMAAGSPSRARHAATLYSPATLAPAWARAGWRARGRVGGRAGGARAARRPLTRACAARGGARRRGAPTPTRAAARLKAQFNLIPDNHQATPRPPALETRPSIERCVRERLTGAVRRLRSVWKRPIAAGSSRFGALAAGGGGAGRPWPWL